MTFTQRLFTIGCFLFFWYACLAIIPQVSLLLGFKLAVWQVAASFALFLVASWAFQFKFLEQKSFVSFGLNLAFATAIFYFGLIYSNQFFDISFDGNYYHLDAIYLLKKGWNPVYHVLIEEETSYSDKYLNHFPKSSWVVSTAIYILTDNAEMGKSVNFMLLISSFLIAQNIFKTLFNLSLASALVLAFSLSASPIVILNLFSNCVDGQVAALMAIGLMLCIMQIRNGGWVYGLLALLSFAILGNMKFTTAAYSVIYVFGFLFYLFVYKKESLKKVIWVGIIWGIFTFGILGWNPYISNLIRKGHPLYPMSENIENVFEKNAIYPANFLEMNWAERFYASLFAQPSWARNPQKSEIKKLFSTYDLLPYESGVPDLAGFGPYVAEVVLFLIPLFLLIFYLVKKQVKYGVLWLASILMASIFIHPEAWLFRYVPQLWILIHLFIFTFFYHSKLKYVTWIFVGFLLYNNYMVYTTYLASNSVRTEKFKKEVAVIVEHPGEYLYYHGWTKSSLYRLQSLGLSKYNDFYFHDSDTTKIPFTIGLGTYFKKRITK